MVPIGSGAGRDVENVMLTRYACYLAAKKYDVDIDELKKKIEAR